MASHFVERQRVGRLAVLLAGAILLALLVYRIGTPAIAASFSLLSWRLLLIVCFPALLMTVFDTLGWHFSFRSRQISFRALWNARLAGEAVNLTTAQVGGEAVKAWLLRPHVTLTESVPAIIVAKTTIAIAQVVFLALGFVCALLTLPWQSSLLRGMLLLLGVEGAAVGGFVLVQATGVIGNGGRILGRFRSVAAGQGSQALLDLNGALVTLYRSEPWRMLLSVSCYLCTLGMSVFEAYLILHFLRIPVRLLTVVVIEACGTAIRFATFVVPGSLGALEGGYMATFLGLGLEGGTGLAFSLIRRVREAAWSAVGCLVLAAFRPVLSPAHRLDPNL
jgi:uncharacterized membrane protein YbhN (UPF0104 family)